MSNASQFTAQLSANKVSNVLGLLPPALIAAAAAGYALAGIRSAPGAVTDEGGALPGPGT